MYALPYALTALAALTVATAKDIVITVGHNTTGNPGAVFDPQEVTAEIGDNVVFNFTLGNHTATQSTFAGPCVPAHETNSTINGFDSSFRNAGNGTAITNLNVTIDTNATIWFFDWNTCAEGGVGGININESSTQTLAGFERNAIRLNGTNTTTSTSASATATSPGSGSSTSASSTSTQSASGKSSGAERRAVAGALGAAPLVLAALALAL
ncbi:hypothetical protein WOLCODRAFT_28150 [Wolfiporia cocos MD-104 SS10]|uniref:Cupredoxin n=1 Tax=Wolfiporia cocos (strain MD-104) TaxID=742152 RepID=A0A2H3J0P8_WOLCO|nr:hypothetical protein WOLCODRAFT_28150 [Wolfiporia cocos MD-104 SS10]